MTRYIGFAVGGADDPAWADEELAQRAMERYQAWDERLRAQGRLVGGVGLGEDAQVIRRDGEGVVVSKGPFAEAAEIVGGYAEVEADSMAEAVELFRDHPHLDYGGFIEVREVTL